MREVFYEESAKIQDEKSATRKYNLFKAFSISSYVLFVVWIFVILMYDFSGGSLIANIIFLAVPFIMFLVSGIFLGKVKYRFYIDYDYTFVSGSIRIAKIVKNLKRKPLYKFDVSSIERLGKYDSDTYKKYSVMPGVSKVILTSNVQASEGKDFYYLVVNIEGNKKLLIFECTELFMVNVLKFANKGILEGDYK